MVAESTPARTRSATCAKVSASVFEYLNQPVSVTMDVNTHSLLSRDSTVDLWQQITTVPAQHHQINVGNHRISRPSRFSGRRVSTIW